MAIFGGIMTSLSGFDRPLFLIGCGNMAGAILRRWLTCGLNPALVTVTRPSGRPVAEGVTVRTDYPDHLPEGAVVLVGMKPQQLAAVAPQLQPLWRPDLTMLSLLAGVPVARLAETMASPDSAVRLMPNTPVALGKGVCALYADPAMPAERRALVDTLLAPLGLVEWIAAEEQFDLVTALSGCGPAFVFRFIDALAQGAARLGMDAAQAGRFALATVDGAATLAMQAGESPADLAEKVASKGGMTREGLDVLDAEDRLINLLTDTLRAARDRGVALNRLSA